ncbi:adenylyl-sulfate kinase [Algoriphagus limi]|uniref:Adenylyl-sulfate kinase n=1 Tax=Algoriphagus limi TaxID=2975273 RepID=A0ABT2G1Z3_9BACT|nr:adenylyl-sulfate kinase [Algoriphagus limi]MCS5489194.1 adenylyl-sulfate kinase [Algoriphagus limi]
MGNHIHPTEFKISKADRRKRLNQNPKLIWFTGLSGSGKSTIANAVEARLFEKGHMTFSMDGDNIRTGLCKDLGFSDQDRVENIRRIGEVAKLMLDAGLVVISSFISPFKSERKLVAELVEEENFIEVFVDCPLEVCEQRDVKGLYKKARAGVIKSFTGIDSPYEKPENPAVHIYSDQEELQESVNKVIEFVLKKIAD